MRYNADDHHTAMELSPAIKSLTVQNLLSFGDKPTTIELRSLNVLIGPNGSGKSNLIELIGLLQQAPKELATAISNGGGIEEWLWKGASKPPVASIEVITRPWVHGILKSSALRYRLAFTRSGFRFQVIDERVENELPAKGSLQPFFYFGYENGHPMLSFKGEKRGLRKEEISPEFSILAQRKDPEHYPEITYLGNLFSSFRLYRDWEFGGLADVREPCDAGLTNDFLEEDGSNLGVVLDRLLSIPAVKREIIDYLRGFYEPTSDLRTSLQGSKVQTRLEENGLTSGIPLIRMSDGTVRWLVLLSILLNPEPPRLVCIEEPELGLHPDMVHELGKLLISASKRMQLIVTTHSDALVEEFSEMPESVLVCEKEEGSSTFKRLDADELSSWLKDYSLGQLWRKGQIGGNRW
jgi:predicted ATPase